MRAIVHDKYGPLEQLELRDIARPTIGPSEVLVRVHAAGLHIADSFGVHGAPFAMRLVSGLLKPKLGVPGFDLAGRVEAVGAQVTRFKVGDAVFGAAQATCAEYASASEDTLALKPSSLSFEQAAALPTSALAALHALRDVARIQPGQRLLVIGASGGIGTFAVQLGKHFGAEVTGVCSARNLELVRGLGADHVIDYETTDFAAGDQRYDVILDNVENRSLAECRRALAPTGTLIVNSGRGADGIGMLFRLLHPVLLSPFVRQNLRRYLSRPNHADLVVLKDLVEAGKLEPVIDRRYPLLETAAALRHIEAGHARGKVVVAV